MVDKMLRLNDVLEIIPVGKSTWWSWVKSGKAPKQIKLSAGVSVWRESEVKNFIENSL